MSGVRTKKVDERCFDPCMARLAVGTQAFDLAMRWGVYSFEVAIATARAGHRVLKKRQAAGKW